MEKLDAEGRQLLAAYKLRKQIEKKYLDPKEVSRIEDALRSLLPGSVQKENIDVTQIALDTLKAAGFPVWPDVNAGRQKLPVGVARFLASVNGLATLINDAEFRRVLSVTGAFVLVIFQQLWEEVANPKLRNAKSYR